MPHLPLDPAYLRVQRGREHLVELEELCDEACDWYAEQLHGVYPPTVLKEERVG